MIHSTKHAVGLVYSLHVQIEGSLLASMFSGRWEQSLDHDSQGRIFLDFEPYCFRQILTSLRCRQLRADVEEKTAAPPIEPAKKDAYNCLVDYLGLQEALGPCLGAENSTPSEGLKIAHASNHVLVQRAMVDGQWAEMATCSPEFGPDTHHVPFVTVGPRMISGQVYVLKVSSTQPLAFLGIAKDAGCSHNVPNAAGYGWSSSPSSLHNSHCWSAGTSTVVSMMAQGVFKSALIQVDLITGHLICIDAFATHQFSGYRVKVPIPSGAQQSYMFRFNTHGRNSLRLLPVSAADKQLFARASDSQIT